MKFTIARAPFIKTLNDVSRAITTRTTIPILSGIKVDLTATALTMTGSDADISIVATLNADDEASGLQIETPGSVVVQARIFTDIVKQLPEDTLTIETKENFQTVVTSGSSEFTINALDANNYPRLPEITPTEALSVPPDVLKQLIDQTAMAVSVQESRPILTGVHLTLEGGQLVAVATDSHRLSQRSLELPDTATTADVVVPGKSLLELSRMLSEDSQNVELRFSENQILFVTGNIAFYSRLLEGNYPDTSRLIPTTNSTQVEFDALTLLAAIQRASLVSHSSSNNIVRMTLDVAAQTATIFGNSPEVGNVEEALSFVKLTGDNLEISFNPDYMKDALRGFGKTTVTIAFTAPLRPFTLVPSEDAAHYIQLITPVRTY